MWLFAKKTAVSGRVAVGAGKAVNVPPKPVAKHQTAADRLDWYCRKHNAKYEIKRTSAGVTLLVYLPQGDVIASNAITMMTAVVEATNRMEQAR